MMTLVMFSLKAVEEEDKMTPEQLAIKNVGKQVKYFILVCKKTVFQLVIIVILSLLVCKNNFIFSLFNICGVFAGSQEALGGAR